MAITVAADPPIALVELRAVIRGSCFLSTIYMVQNAQNRLLKIFTGDDIYTGRAWQFINPAQPRYMAPKQLIWGDFVACSPAEFFHSFTSTAWRMMFLPRILTHRSQSTIQVVSPGKIRLLLYSLHCQP
jgi:hypothetical protein